MARKEKAAPAPSSAPKWFQKGPATTAGRSPKLTETMTSVAKSWTRRFMAVSAAPGEILFKATAMVPFEELLAKRSQIAVFATLHAAEWNSLLALQFEQAFVAATVEALFGGAGEEEASAHGGPLSPVESGIADVIGKHAAEALADGFSDLLPTTMAFERTHAKIDWSLLGKPGSSIMIATFVLKSIGRPVEIDVLIPQVAMNRINGLLSSDPLAGSSADPLWAERLEAEVTRAAVTLQAVLELRPMSLGALATLKPGQVLALPDNAGSDVRLSCDNGDLFRCELGQSNGFYTVRIDEAVAETLSSRKPH